MLLSACEHLPWKPMLGIAREMIYTHTRRLANDPGPHPTDPLHMEGLKINANVRKRHDIQRTPITWVLTREGWLLWERKD